MSSARHGRGSERGILALLVLVFSTWTFARLASRYDPHWGLFLLCGACVGAVVGALSTSARRGAWVGAVGGLAVGAAMVPYEIVLWMTFTLPPHPEFDL